MPQDITDPEFEAMVSSGVSLVDFWAPWCGPCQMIKPILEEIASEYEDKGVQILKLNVDDNPEKSMEYNVRSIPTLIVFKDGKPMETIIGLRDKKSYTDLIDAQLAD